MAEKKMNCRSCGKEMQDDFLVCPFCGTPRELHCAKCGKPLEEDFKNCPYCGEPVRPEGAKSRPPKGSSDFSGKAAGVLMAIGAFLYKAGTAIGAGAVAAFNWLKNAAQKTAAWIRGLDWAGLKESLGKFFSSVGGLFKKAADGVRSQDWDGAKEKVSQGAKSAGTFFQKALAWLKSAAITAWSFLKDVYHKLRDFISGTILKKLDPEKSRRLAAIILAGCLLACLLLSAVLFLSNGGQSKPTGSATEEAAGAAADATKVPVDPSEQRWLVMVYADADDGILEEDIYFDLNEMEAVGSSDRVQIVAQIDRYAGGYEGDGDWYGARRYEIEQDEDLFAATSNVVEDLGEIDMGSTDTLVDFATWAIETYPADRHVLIMSDHGSGWIGGWFDDDPNEGQVIWLDELDTALETIVQQSGIGKFDLVGMDACLMGMMEVYDMLAPHSEYAVASEETEPGVGWAYSYFLGKLNEQPEMSTAALASAIVEGYLQEDLRILDDEARKALLAQYNVTDDVPPKDLMNEMGGNITLSAIDLSAMPALQTSLNDLLLALKESDQGAVAVARGYAQPFENVFNDKKPTPFIDLGSFLSILAENNEDETLGQLITDARTTYGEAIVAEKHGPNRPGASGIAIHFPISDHYWTESVYDSTQYPVRAKRFTENSLWDDYLAYHYAEKDFGTGVPDAAERVRAPGFSQIQVNIPVVSPDTVPLDDPLLHVEADVSGEHIAYVYGVVLLRYQDRYLMYSRDYLPPASFREVEGVTYPVWRGENGVFRVSDDFLVAPTVITDGTTTVFAVVEPDTYARSREEIIYAVKGFHIDGESGERTSARMYFNNDGENEMRSIIGYYGSVETGIQARPIKQKKGDQFLFLDTWWEQDEDGQWADVLREGNTLTFNDAPFVQGIALKGTEAGEYAVGVIVTDMDGNEWAGFAPVTVAGAEEPDN